MNMNMNNTIHKLATNFWFRITRRSVSDIHITPNRIPIYNGL